MSISPHNTITNPVSAASETYVRSATEVSQLEAGTMSSERHLVVQAMGLLIRLDRDLRQARAQFNQDWFRRLMRIRRPVVFRLRRRCEKIEPLIPLGNLRRRYHANLARYLYSVRKDY